MKNNNEKSELETQSALKLLEQIDVSRYYKIDEFDDQTDIDKTEFEEVLKNNEKCGFEFFLEVDYSVPIDYDTSKKSDSCGFYEDCFYFPFSEETLKLLDNLGYDEKYFKDWVKQHYGKPDYEEIWDGETLYDKDNLDRGDEQKYSCVWKVYDYFKIEFFSDKKKTRYMKTFLKSFFQVGLVAINTYFMTQFLWVGVFIISFTISLLWAFNVSKVAVSTTKQKLIYALGGGCGAVCGLALLKLFL